MPNLYLPGASILLSLFLVILFFSKKRQKNSDTKIFQFMIIIQLLESAVETIIYYIAYTSNNVFMLIFLNNIICTCYLLWVYLFYKYLLNISLKNKNINKSKSIQKIELVINFIIIFIIIISPIGLMNENEIMYSYGMKPTITYIACAIWFLSSIIVTLSNIRNLNNKKYIPLCTLQLKILM